MLSGENMENSVDPNMSDKVAVSRYIGRIEYQRGKVTALIGNFSLGVARTMTLESPWQASTFQPSSPTWEST